MLVVAALAAAALAWSAAPVRAVPPFIKSFSPAKGATGVPLDTNIVLTMSEVVSLAELAPTTTTTVAPSAGSVANTPCKRRGATRIVGGTTLTCRRVTVWRQG